MNELNFNMGLMALDLAMSHTGVAIYQIAPVQPQFEFKILEYFQVEIPSGYDRETRLRKLLELIQQPIIKRRINVVVVEEPVTAMFSAKRLVGLMDLFAACYGLMGWCYANNLYVRGISAKKWQAESGCPNEKGISKKWSVAAANMVLKYLKRSTLRKASDHHTADAINIGLYAIRQWNSGDWELPSQFNLPIQSITQDNSKS